jgi:hypothetical protein
VVHGAGGGGGGVRGAAGGGCGGAERDGFEEEGRRLSQESLQYGELTQIVCPTSPCEVVSGDRQEN